MEKQGESKGETMEKQGKQGESKGKTMEEQGKSTGKAREKQWKS